MRFAACLDETAASIPKLKCVQDKRGGFRQKAGLYDCSEKCGGLPTAATTSDYLFGTNAFNFAAIASAHWINSLRWTSLRRASGCINVYLAGGISL